MRFDIQQFSRTVILAAFAIFFIKLHVTGDITKYVNPKYDVMSQMAAGIFVFLFFVQMTRVWRTSQSARDHCSAGCGHHHGEDASLAKKGISYGILILPLIIGFSLSPETLNSTMAENKGMILTKGDASNTDTDSDPSSIHTNNSELHKTDPLPNNNYIEEEDYQKEMERFHEGEYINMQKDLFSPYYDDISLHPREFAGKEIKLKGFVYREEGLRSNQLIISRFLITHCIADAIVIGLITEFEQAHTIEEDQWMEIEGILDVTTYDGVEVPVIKGKRGKVIEEPSEPYVYPVLRRVAE
ncbi:TIGR03943 family putative permease subunit [Salibacterium aidingense]|uniref:TIGR03943 family putative permease subunit n=1 Tax=Salibacterium aidingense TaxID=384933 RepID=UPI000429DCE6|nr:TIGR03943 family protein [Salibacterium aidingense]